MLCVLGGWQWYYWLYQFRLSEVEKQQYVEEHFRETIFQEKAFRAILETLAERQRLAEKQLNIQRDIFVSDSVPPRVGE
ncbi:MAG: hypothetical protein ACSLEX_01880 [Minisyncoccota bacterium]